VITVDKNAAYPPAFDALQPDSTLPETCRLRQCKYVNNMIEQDHRLVKRLVTPGLGFGAFHTAQRTIPGYEAMHRLRKGQIEGIAKGDVLAQNRVINQLCGLAASRELTTRFSHAHEFLQHNLQCWRYLSLTICDIIGHYGPPRRSQDAEDNPHGDIAAGAIRRPGVLARQVSLGTPASR
jgi:DDE domain